MDAGFGADPKVIGRSIPLDGTPFTVIGVMPSGFESTPPADLWTTIGQVAESIGGGGNYEVIARLKPGVSVKSASQRTHEIGIRIALGATRRVVLGAVMREGLRLTLIGIAAGLAAAVPLTRILGTLLFGVRPTDPLTITASTDISSKWPALKPRERERWKAAPPPSSASRRRSVAK